MHGKILDFLTLRKAAYRWSFIGGFSIVLFFVPYNFLEKAKLSLYERFHIPSPSIGLTRAYWKLIHGDIYGAWQRNKLIFVVLSLLIAILVYDLLQFCKRRNKDVI